VIEQFCNIIEGEGIREPLLMITDRELALINTLDTQFPNSNHILYVVACNKRLDLLD
jgi:hypothetical protein